jgi:hypothetical protein
MALSRLGTVFAFFLVSITNSSAEELFIERTGLEPSPDEVAEMLGVSPSSSGRTVPERDFTLYPLVVDFFKASKKLPVLGEYRPEYADLVPSKAVFDRLAASEFAVVSLHGVPLRAYLVSGGAERRISGVYRRTPPGNYRMDPVVRKVRLPDSPRGSEAVSVPFPWLRSRTYGNSAMYWGLWMFGGYFIHSTTHYGEIGRPASMGCVRQSYPDAMELFTQAQEHRSMIRVHAVDSERAFDRFRELTSVEWVLPRLVENDARFRTYIKRHGKEIHVLGHAWLTEEGKEGVPEWPLCGPTDCFKVWGKKEPASVRSPLRSVDAF